MILRTRGGGGPENPKFLRTYLMEAPLCHLQGVYGRGGYSGGFATSSRDDGYGGGGGGGGWTLSRRFLSDARDVWQQLGSGGDDQRRHEMAGIVMEQMRAQVVKRHRLPYLLKFSKLSWINEP